MKKIFRSLCVLMIGLSLSIVTSVMVMINGWGLQPKSWWWIIGVYTIGNIVAHMILAAANTDDE